MSIQITIDGQSVEVPEGQTVLAAAQALGIDIPTLCYLEQCGPTTSCLVCLVKINGRLVPSCGAKAAPGMVVESETPEVHAARRTALELLFSNHVGDCLSPCNRLCPLQLNIPVMLRQIEAGKPGEAALTVRQAFPLAAVLGRLCNHPCEQGCRRTPVDGAASIRELERFVADRSVEQLPVCQSASGKRVAIVGAGPAGLTAAFGLMRQGHSVTVFDRHDRAGGALRGVSEKELPPEILAGEIAQLTRQGIDFKLSVEVGNQGMLEDLRRDFDAVLLATGESGKSESAKLGVPAASAGIKTESETGLTDIPRVFAAGSAVKTVKLLVRAMAEGKAAAECIHRFLAGEPIRRAGKPFSSVMGRLDPGELKLFLRSANPQGRTTACDACAGFSNTEAVAEAGRCLHCDCRSSGHCGLQHYAQLYNVDAGRFRGSRVAFEQYIQAGTVIFEPGKCILCGICVKLTAKAGEPLGLTFVGRGFEVRIATPFNKSIEEGLQKIAEECVQHCPTGALTFRKTC